MRLPSSWGSKQFVKQTSPLGEVIREYSQEWLERKVCFLRLVSVRTVYIYRRSMSSTIWNPERPGLDACTRRLQPNFRTSVGHLSQLSQLIYVYPWSLQHVRAALPRWTMFAAIWVFQSKEAAACQRDGPFLVVPSNSFGFTFLLYHHQHIYPKCIFLAMQPYRTPECYAYTPWNNIFQVVNLQPCSDFDHGWSSRSSAGIFNKNPRILGFCQVLSRTLQGTSKISGVCIPSFLPISCN